MSDHPDPGLMDRFCSEILQGMLVEACDVDASDAVRVADDVRLRAEAVAHLDQATREILAAPFFEDSFSHDPADASPWLKAITALVIRNSELEDIHSNGPVKAGGLTAVTKYGLAPLSHLLAARERQPLPGGPLANPFADLAEEYPRAWACLTALRQSLTTGGGRTGYKMPDAPLPLLPETTEVVEAPSADLLSPTGELIGVLFSGLDQRFDQTAFGYLKSAQDGDLLLGLSSLSRISRNSRKLLRALDFLLAYHTKIITTNSLLTSREVWVRNKRIVKPNSREMMSGLEDMRGLSGTHKKTVESYIDYVS